MQRLTQQRKIILEELCGVHSHPTAEEIYALVRSRIPKVSLATVYRNLDALARDGQVLKLHTRKNEKARYDGKTNQHCHLVCKKCGSVVDIFDCAMQFSSDEMKKSGFEIQADHLELPGICKKCNP